MEISVTGHSVGFASTNLTLKNMQDTFINGSNEVLHILAVSILRPFFFEVIHVLFNKRETSYEIMTTRG